MIYFTFLLSRIKFSIFSIGKLEIQGILEVLIPLYYRKRNGK